MRTITARSSSILNIFFDVVAAAILVGTGLSGAPAATSAGPANADAITVCEGSSLSTLDSSGAPLPQEQSDVLVRQLQGLCDASVGTSREFGEDTSDRLDAEAKQSDGFSANVAAQINAGPGVMGISEAYAQPVCGLSIGACRSRMKPTDPLYSRSTSDGTSREGIGRCAHRLLRE